MKFSILFSLFLLNACSYSLGYKPATLLGKYKEVRVKLFNNHTQYAGIESVFTDNLISKFHLENRKIIQDFAPIELQANILSVQVSPVSRGNVNSVILITEYRVIIKLKVVLQERWSEKTLWTKTLQKEASYIPPQISISELSSVSSFYNNSALKLAFADLAKVVASDIYTSLSDRF